MCVNDVEWLNKLVGMQQKAYTFSLGNTIQQSEAKNIWKYIKEKL